MRCNVGYVQSFTLDGLEARGRREGACLVWPGKPKPPGGYGQVRHDGRVWYVHRLVLILAGAEIPPGYEPDHTCRNPICYRREHLEVVTKRENNRRSGSITAQHARKKTCPKGHAYDGTRKTKSGAGRVCRTCKRQANARQRRARRQRSRARQEEAS